MLSDLRVDGPDYAFVGCLRVINTVHEKERRLKDLQQDHDEIGGPNVDRIAHLGTKETTYTYVLPLGLGYRHRRRWGLDYLTH